MNFDFHWAETGASTNPCSNLYAGEYAFSEPEAQYVLSSNRIRPVLERYPISFNPQIFVGSWMDS
jgi:hypothetical protein